MWHPDISGDGTAGGYATAWRHGWRLGPRAAQSHTGPVRRLYEAGHSYSYVGTAPWDQSIPLKVAAAIGVHGRWEQPFSSSATNSAVPDWLEMVGRWRIINGTGLKLEAASARGQLWFENESMDGWLSVNMTGMANYTNVWLGAEDSRNGYLLVGSATFAGWTVQLIEDGVVTWSSVQGLTGFPDGQWWFSLQDRTLRVITPANATWAVWELPKPAPGTRIGIEGDASSAGTLAVREIRWCPMQMEGVSGSIMAGNDTIGVGSWSHTYQQQTPCLGRGDVAMLLWGINDLVAQSTTKMGNGFAGVLSWLLAGGRPSSESAEFDRRWAPDGIAPYDGLTEWTADAPTDWRHSGTWIHSCSIVGGALRVPVDAGLAGRTVGLRFADEPIGGSVSVRSLSAAGSQIAEHVSGLAISGGTGYSGYRAAKTVRIQIPTGARSIEVEVVSLLSGGKISFDGWHVERPDEAPRIVWGNIAHLGSSPPYPWSTVTAAKIDAANVQLRGIAAGFGSPRIVEADLDGAIGGNDSMFSDGLHPNAAGATACAAAYATALAATEP